MYHKLKINNCILYRYHLPAKHLVNIPTGSSGSIMDISRAGEGVYWTRVGV